MLHIKNTEERKNTILNRNRENGENRFAYLVNAPMIIYLACFLAFPMVWGLYMSFTNKTIGTLASFVGFKNYIRLLGDAEYRRSILNTVFLQLFPFW